MTKAQKNLMVRVITKRMSEGETFDEIIVSYPKLTAEEIAELKEAVGA